MLAEAKLVFFVRDFERLLGVFPPWEKERKVSKTEDHLLCRGLPGPKFPKSANIPIRGNSSFLRNLMIRFIHVRGDDKYYRQHKRRGKDWKFWSIERYPRLHELNGAIDGRFC